MQKRGEGKREDLLSVDDNCINLKCRDSICNRENRQKQISTKHRQIKGSFKITQLTDHDHPY